MVHLGLVCALVGKAAAIIVVPLEHHVFKLLVAIIFVIVKHAEEAALFLLLELLASTELARPEFEALFEEFLLKLSPVFVIIKLFSDDVILRGNLLDDLGEAR